MALDSSGKLAVAHAGLGSVWVFGDTGRPIHEIRTGAETLTTNVAFGGPDRSTLYITTADRIWTAKLDAPGKPLFSHA